MRRDYLKLQSLSALFASLFIFKENKLECECIQAHSVRELIAPKTR